MKTHILINFNETTLDKRSANQVPTCHCVPKIWVRTYSHHGDFFIEIISEFRLDCRMITQEYFTQIVKELISYDPTIT